MGHIWEAGNVSADTPLARLVSKICDISSVT